MTAMFDTITECTGLSGGNRFHHGLLSNGEYHYLTVRGTRVVVKEHEEEQEKVIKSVIIITSKRLVIDPIETSRRVRSIPLDSVTAVESISENQIALTKQESEAKLTIELQEKDNVERVISLLKDLTIEASSETDPIAKHESAISSVASWWDTVGDIVSQQAVFNVDLSNRTRGALILTADKLYFQSFATLFKSNDEPESHWSLKNVQSAIKKPFMQLDLALEVYFDGQTSIFVVFGSTESRDAFYDNLVSNGVPVLSLEEVTDRWNRRLFSNYEYLMYVNSFAGRTTKEASQYPVFPWLISKYGEDVSQMDIVNSRNYRNLSKPIKAINVHRQVSPSAHFAEPTRIIRYLQRKVPALTAIGTTRFYSIEQEWNTVMCNPDVITELIPEFYEGDGSFLKSSQMGDVVLPHWAKTPIHFIRTLRCALESEHTSINLHKWVDLVFGVRSRGDETNTYADETYVVTGTDATLSVVDPMGMRLFGSSSPAQIFTSPHVERAPSRYAAVCKTMERIHAILKKQAIVDKQKAVEELHALQEERKREVQNLEHDLDTYRVQLVAMKDRIPVLEQEVAELNDKQAMKQSEVEKLEASIDAYLAELQSLKEHIPVLDQEITQLKDTNATLSADLATSVANAEQLDKKCDEQSVQLFTLEMIKNKLAERELELLQSIEDMEAKHAESIELMETKHRELEAAIVLRDEQNDIIRADLKLAEDKNNVLTRDLDIVCNSLASKEKAYDTYVAEATGTISTLKDEHNAYVIKTDEKIATLTKEAEEEFATLKQESDEKIATLAKDTEEAIATLKKESEETIATLGKVSEETITTLRKESEDKIATLTKESEETIAALKQESEEKIATLTKEHEDAIATLKQESEEKIATLQKESDETISTLKQESESTISTLKQESESTIATLKQESEEKIATLNQESETTISALKQESETAISTLKQESETTISTLKQESETTISTMKKEFEETIATMKQDFEEKVATLAKESEVAITTLKQESEEKIATLQKESEETISTLKKESEEKLAALKSEAEAKEADLSAKISELESTVESLKAALAVAEEKITTLTTELEAANEKIDVQTKGLNVLTEENAALSEQLVNVTQELEQTVEALKNMTASKEAADAEISSLNSRVQELSLEIEALKQESADQKNQIEELTQKNTDLTNTLADTENQLSDARSKIESLLEEQKQQIAESTATIEDLKTVQATLEGQLSESQADSRVKSDLIAEQENQIADLTQNKEQLEQSLSELKQEYETLSAHDAETVQHLQERTASLQEAEDKIADMTALLAELNKDVQLRKLRATIETLEKAFSQEKKKNERLLRMGTSSESAMQAIEIMENQIDELQTKVSGFREEKAQMKHDAKKFQEAADKKVITMERRVSDMELNIKKLVLERDDALDRKIQYELDAQEAIRENRTLQRTVQTLEKKLKELADAPRVDLNSSDIDLNTSGTIATPKKGSSRLAVSNTPVTTFPQGSAARTNARRNSALSARTSQHAFESQLRASPVPQHPHYQTKDKLDTNAVRGVANEFLRGLQDIVTEEEQQPTATPAVEEQQLEQESTSARKIMDDMNLLLKEDAEEASQLEKIPEKIPEIEVQKPEIAAAASNEEV